MLLIVLMVIVFVVLVIWYVVECIWCCSYLVMGGLQMNIKLFYKEEFEFYSNEFFYCLCKVCFVMVEFDVLYKFYMIFFIECGIYENIWFKYLCVNCVGLVLILVYNGNFVYEFDDIFIYVVDYVVKLGKLFVLIDWEF